MSDFDEKPKGGKFDPEEAKRKRDELAGGTKKASDDLQENARKAIRGKKQELPQEESLLGNTLKWSGEKLKEGFGYVQDKLNSGFERVVNDPVQAGKEAAIGVIEATPAMIIVREIEGRVNYIRDEYFGEDKKTLPPAKPGKDSASDTLNRLSPENREAVDAVKIATETSTPASPSTQTANSQPQKGQSR